ncbi:tetratricopeptide repeat protein [Moorena producens JHB]|uniref:Tetratricopeptide repeat protein n=1 Tax=Moorena producens (strain JHB) TaxID=1454205 RepID=A0A1D9G8V3_MOOP1|nr:tetratricopeptide repeat protein [Moorena producens]AOY84033.1 tetratricopeptide repeat protein [Moorena producens JHB]
MIKVESTYQQVKAYLANKQWGQAVACCRQALKRQPDSGEFNVLLGFALAAQGKRSQAIYAYSKAVQLQPEQAQTHACLGELYSQLKDFSTAEWHYQQAVWLQPGQAEYHYNLGITRHKLWEWDAAKESYQQAIALNPKDAKAHYHLGVLYGERGQLEKATNSYRQAITNQPDYLSAYNNLGCVLFELKQFEAAKAVYQQGIDQQGIDHNPKWGTLYNNLGKVLQAQGKAGEALVAYSSAIELNPELKSAYLNLGRLWQQKGNYAVAVQYFERLLRLDPEQILTYSECASALMAQGKLALAFDYLRKAIALQPAFVEAYCQRAKGLPGQDILERSQIYCSGFLSALRNKEDTFQVCLYLWQTYLYLGDTLFEYGAAKQAEKYYQKALQIQPDQVELYIRLGDCLAEQQRLDAAVMTYHMGLALQPAHPHIYLRLGQVLSKQKRFQQALEYYEALWHQHLEEGKVSGKLGSFGVLPIDNVPIDNLPRNNYSAKPVSSQPPHQIKGIYEATRDWYMSTECHGCYYIEVPWSSIDKHLNTMSMVAPPVSPLAPISVEPSQSQSQAQSQSRSQCGGVTCNQCMRRLCNQFESIHLGNRVYQCNPPETLSVDSPTVFVATIPEGRAWIAPQSSYWKICHAIAIITPDDYLLSDVSRNYPWYLPGCENYDPRNHIIFSLEQMPPLEYIDGTVAVLSGLSGHGYYHWLFDVLPRIEILRRSGIDFAKIDWFLINTPQQPFQEETLNCLGIPAHKIISSDRYPHIQAQELVLPSFPGHFDWVPKGTIYFLRQRFLPQALELKYPERIYITRDQARHRQVLNETEVKELLSQFGFITIALESLSVREQVALFASVKAIVAPHGAGLTNTVFCRPGTQIIELVSPNYVRTDYWMISQQLGLKHYYVKGENFDCKLIRQLIYTSSLTEDILVNLDSLYSVIKITGLNQLCSRVYNQKEVNDAMTRNI